MLIIINTIACFDIHHLAFGINLLFHFVNLILIILILTFFIPII